jgi:23S rRNA (uracil1939-C5)-methyltransferase
MSSGSSLTLDQEVSLTIYALAYGSEGIAKHEGMVVFVPEALPGDTVRVRLTQVKSKFARGEIVELIKPSDKRVQPFCSHASACGGCTWEALEYGEQLEAKRIFVENALVHIGHLKTVTVNPTLKASPQAGYRHKIQIPFQQGSGGVTAGFYAKHTHSVVPVEECPNQPALGNKIFREARALIKQFGYTGYNEISDQGQVRHLVIRLGANTHEALAILVTRERELPRLSEWAAELRQRIPELVGVLQNVNPAKTNVILSSEYRTLFGRAFFFEQLRGLKYRISAESFFQVNPFQMPALAGVVLEAAALTGKETVLDLFCGVGWLTLELARQARWVVGVESVRLAIEDARANAQLNNMNNVEFIAADASAGAAQLRAKGVKPDVVVVDPPRKGCDRSVIDVILRWRPKRIVYVSCNPVTLARDLALMFPRGYALKSAQPVDLFPHTYHVETVACLVRIGEPHVG